MSSLSPMRENSGIFSRRTAALSRLAAAMTWVVALTSMSVAAAQSPAGPPASSPVIIFPAMTLSAPAFEDGGRIPSHHTRAAASPTTPELQWAEAPAGTVSFALVVTDIDSINPQRSAYGVLHWMVFNIPGSSRRLPEAMPAIQVMPDGTVQGRNFRKHVGYLPPGAPASGPVHHYNFELFALDTLLDLGPEATRAELMQALEGHVIARAVTIGRFRLEGDPP
jgi:Raf kinase inhibitor-like YbhB/YbcL family protein